MKGKMDHYDIQINSRVGDDSFRLKKEEMKQFDIFGLEVENDPDTFPLSVITFNEDISDDVCMAIAVNISQLLRCEYEIKDDSEESQTKIKNLAIKGPYTDSPFIVSEAERTFLALSRLMYNNIPVMNCLAKMAYGKDADKYSDPIELRSNGKCKIYHCN